MIDLRKDDSDGFFVVVLPGGQAIRPNANQMKVLDNGTLMLYLRDYLPNGGYEEHFIAAYAAGYWIRLVSSRSWPEQSQSWS